MTKIDFRPSSRLNAKSPTLLIEPLRPYIDTFYNTLLDGRSKAGRSGLVRSTDRTRPGRDASRTAVRRLSAAALDVKEGLYTIWCGVNRLGDTSAFVNLLFNLSLLTRRVS